MRLVFPVALLVLLISSCAPAPRPVAPPPRAPAPAVQPRVSAPPPALAAHWQDWPATPGTWVYQRDARGSIARFGRSGADADLVIRCVLPTRRIYLSRPGAFVAGETGTMWLRTSSGEARYPLANSGGEPPYVAAEFSPRDPMLDALAFSRGKFIISVKGAADLVIPAWPEPARVIEDCR